MQFPLGSDPNGATLRRRHSLTGEVRIRFDVNSTVAIELHGSIRQKRKKRLQEIEMVSRLRRVILLRTRSLTILRLYHSLPLPAKQIHNHTVILNVKADLEWYSCMGVQNLPEVKQTPVRDRDGRLIKRMYLSGVSLPGEYLDA